MKLDISKAAASYEVIASSLFTFSFVKELLMALLITLASFTSSMIHCLVHQSCNFSVMTFHRVAGRAEFNASAEPNL